MRVSMQLGGLGRFSWNVDFVPHDKEVGRYVHVQDTQGRR